jgi:hypothetical protein
MTLKTALLAFTFFKNSFTELQIILPCHANSLHPDDIKPTNCNAFVHDDSVHQAQHAAVDILN